MGLHALGPRLSRAVGTALALLLAGALVPTPADAAAASVVYHGSRTKPYIALTIDDGYNAPNCRRAADILRALNVPATYFPYAQVFSSAPSTWRYIAARFPVGDHTYTHPNMTRLSYASQLSEIQRAQRRLRVVTNRSMVPLLRPPYGSYNLNTRRAAAAAGIKYLVLWDTSFGDTSPASDAAHLRAATRGTNGSIILMHCGPATSVRILPKVIATYRRRGLKFVTVAQLLGLPSPSPMPSPSPSPLPSATPVPAVSPIATSPAEPSTSPEPSAAPSESAALDPIATSPAEPSTSPEPSAAPSESPALDPIATSPAEPSTSPEPSASEAPSPEPSASPSEAPSLDPATAEVAEPSDAPDADGLTAPPAGPDEPARSPEPTNLVEPSGTADAEALVAACGPDSAKERAALLDGDCRQCPASGRDPPRT